MDIDELKRLAEAANAKPPNESKGTDSEFRRAVLAFEEISTPSLVLELIRQMEGLEYAAEANKTLLLASANRLRQQAAPAVPAPSVPEEWRKVMTELADDLSIELDMRYQSRSHYPSELRKYENEMQLVYRARALLQSDPQPTNGDAK